MKRRHFLKSLVLGTAAVLGGQRLLRPEPFQTVEYDGLEVREITPNGHLGGHTDALDSQWYSEYWVVVYEYWGRGVRHVAFESGFL